MNNHGISLVESRDYTQALQCLSGAFKVSSKLVSASQLNDDTTTAEEEVTTNLNENSPQLVLRRCMTYSKEIGKAKRNVVADPTTRSSPMMTLTTKTKPAILSSPSGKIDDHFRKGVNPIGYRQLLSIPERDPDIGVSSTESSPNPSSEFHMSLNVIILFNLALAHQLTASELPQLERDEEWPLQEPNPTTPAAAAASSTRQKAKANDDGNRVAAKSNANVVKDERRLLLQKSIRLYQLGYELLSKLLPSSCCTTTSTPGVACQQILFMGILTNMAEAYSALQEFNQVERHRQQLQSLLLLFLYVHGGTDKYGLEEEYDFFLGCSGLLQSGSNACSCAPAA